MNRNLALIQRILALFFLVLSLAGFSPSFAGYTIVNGGPTMGGGYYPTIQSAIDSGATHIRVMGGTYSETITIPHSLTLECDRGVVIPNDGTNISITVLAPDVTIYGCAIQGQHDGSNALGDTTRGVGVSVQNSGLHIDGLQTFNLTGFSVIAGHSQSHSLVLENFKFQNVAIHRGAGLCAPTAIQLIASIEHNVVRNGIVTGHSQAIGFWYGVSNSTATGNRLLQNYGFIPDGGGICNVPRSVVEDYGLGEVGNIGNIYRDNYIDGSNGAGFELADVLQNTMVSGNVTRNTYGGAFGVAGSASNRGTNITIASNTFYGRGDDPTNWFSGSGVIRDNLFVGWVQNNVGTIYIPSDVLGDGVSITGNTFDANGRVVRFSGGNVVFSHNTIINPTYTNALYMDNRVKDIWVESNHFYSDGTLTAVDSNGASSLTIRNNYIEGVLWLLAGTSKSVVSGNEIHSTQWLGMSVPTESTVTDNRIYADTNPLYVDGSAIQYSLVADNFYAMYDGSTSGHPPNCGTLNTCTRNRTSGQVPPP